MQEYFLKCTICVSRISPLLVNWKFKKLVMDVFCKGDIYKENLLTLCTYSFCIQSI